MGEPEKQYVTLWSTDPKAVDATRATVRMLPGGNDLHQDARGFYVTGSLGFLRFALVHQGYVRALAETQEGKDGR
jgi:hypothetical protein